MFLGKTQFAEELLAKMAKLVKHGSIQEADMSLIYSSKSVLCEMQGKYHEALEYVDKIIELFIKNGSHIHDLYFTGTYISRAKMLSFLGRYQEAYTQAQQVYNIYKPIKNEDNEIFANIYTEMARSILGLNKVEQAYEYIKKAISIFLASENSNSKQTTNYSNNPDLASSYIVQGDILFTQNRLKQAIESYKKAFVIYHYLYGDRSKNIAQVSDLYNHAAKAACKSKVYIIINSLVNRKLKNLAYITLILPVCLNIANNITWICGSRIIKH